jgi:GT2 family glycosyltransferase
MAWTAVIPTRGDRNHLLLPMVHVLGARNCIIIHTAPTSRHVPGAVNIDDYGPINIHRWWNTGIRTATTDLVAVLNDDLVVNELTVPALAQALTDTGATLAFHDKTSGHYTEIVDRGGVVPVRGWCWTLNREHGVTPDERYRWWYGDNDLALRAIRDGHGIATTPLGEPRHLHANQHTQRNHDLLALTEQDKRTYYTLHN